MQKEAMVSDVRTLKRIGLAAALVVAALLILGSGSDLVVYCAHGPRAAWAGRALRKAGYSDIVYLAGHMTAWEDAGRPLETSSAPSAD